MTDNIMKGNGEVFHRSTYGWLKEDEWTNKYHILLRKEFDSNIKNRFGPEISTDYFPDVNIEDTPLYKMYEDNTTDVEDDLSGSTEYDKDCIGPRGPNA